MHNYECILYMSAKLHQSLKSSVYTFRLFDLFMKWEYFINSFSPYDFKYIHTFLYHTLIDLKAYFIETIKMEEVFVLIFLEKLLQYDIRSEL